MKFSIRDLFLVTVIVALAVGWGVDRAANYRDLREQNARLVKKLDETERLLLDVVAKVSRKKQGIVGPVFETQVESSYVPKPSAPVPNSP